MWLARGYGFLRGVMLIAFSAFLVLAPERAMPGTGTEPGRTLALFFASRTVLFGVAFVVTAIRDSRKGLGWLLLADAALQVFDTAFAVMMHKGAVAAMPAAIGVIDAAAGLSLLRRRA